MAKRAIGHRSPDGVTPTIPARFCVPARRLGSLPREAAFHGGKPFFVPSELGVVVSQRGRLSLHAHDLQRELWRREAANETDWASLVLWDDRVLTRRDGVVSWRELATGQEIHTASGPNGTIQAVTDSVVLFYVAEETAYQAIDHSGQVLWRCSCGPWLATSSGESILIVEDFGRRLRCIGALTGSTKWVFDVPPHGGPGLQQHEIVIGDPGVAVVEREVVVTLRDGRVLVLDLESGECLRSGKPPLFGNFVVTRDSLYFQGPFALSRYDYRHMSEVSRLEYQGDVAPCYRDQPGTSNAFCLSERAVIWTTMHGALIGVSRELKDGLRTVWSDEIPGALMPLAVPPVIYGNYLYYSPMGKEMPLMVWESSG
jgi:hypothetical protein